MALFLGAILGGPEQIDKAFNKQKNALMLRVESLQNGLIAPGDGLLNVVFLFSGTLFQPPFSDIRLGRFIKKENRLELKVPVPPDAITSEDFPQRYVALLKQAIIEAKKVFDKKGIPFSLKDHVALADKSLEGLMETRSMRDDHRFQLVLQLPVTPQQDFDVLLSLEESLADALDGTHHEIDGHDFGSGTGNIFIHTNDPIGAFDLTKKFVDLKGFSRMRAAYRSFEEDDYKLIWPEDSNEEFDLF